MALVKKHKRVTIWLDKQDTEDMDKMLDYTNTNQSQYIREAIKHKIKLDARRKEKEEKEK